ncbi:MAG TPA: hypothetical protein VFP34_04750 [Microlunatus sp.]|nr:hypothetical protein [Microlunatus sp.]
MLEDGCDALDYSRNEQRVSGSRNEIHNGCWSLRSTQNESSNGAVLDLKGARLAADLIRDALHGKLGDGEPESPTYPKGFDPWGLRITNADVQGPIALSDAIVPVAVCITRSHIPQGINLNGARLSRRLDLADSTVGTINLSGTHITGSMS